MDITPHTNLLKSLRGSRTDYVLLIGEAIDNAFDADANRIDVIIRPEVISFDDDGRGIDRAHIGSLFSLGEHVPAATDKIGRFGVGIKSLAVNAGDLFDVVSISRDGRVMAQVDWRAVLISNRWVINEPRWLPHLVGAPSGTTITISALRSSPRISAERLHMEVAQRFYPAIAAGKRIRVNGVAVELLREPLMTAVIDCAVALSDGRTAHIRGGLLAEPSKLNRVHVAYLHRVIMPYSILGCGNYTGLTKLFARVQIAGPWHLGTYKSDLPDDTEREELENAIGAALEPILKSCHSATLDARIDDLASKLNDMLPDDLKSARPRHRNEKPPQSIEQHRKRASGLVDADKADIGGPAKAKSGHRLQITFDGNAAIDGVGAFARGHPPRQPHRVNLSKDHPYVAQLMEARDAPLAARSLFALALAIFEHERLSIAPQSELELDAFGKRLAKLIGMQDADPAIVDIAPRSEGD